MKKSKIITKRLTPRQRIFVHAFAVSGNATRSAQAAGCRKYATAAAQASRWLRNPKVLVHLQEARRHANTELRSVISEAIFQGVNRYINRGGREAASRRCLRLMSKLEIFRHEASVLREVQEVEQAFGMPFGEIAYILDQLSFGATWDQLDRYLEHRESLKKSKASDASGKGNDKTCRQ